VSNLNVVVLGDSHAHPKFNNRRFGWFAKYVNEVKPDVVIDIGDSADMSSIRGYDSIQRSPRLEFEGQKYVLDVEAYHDAMQTFQHDLRHKCEFIKCLGNHEDRIDRLVAAHPRLEGQISQDNLHGDFPMWKVVPLAQPVKVGGFLFAHYFTTPGKNAPVAGATPCRAVAQKRKCSAVFGHTHRSEFYQDHVGTNECITVINAACLMERPQIIAQSKDWAGDTVGTWTSGVWHLRGLKAGKIEGFDFVGIDELKERYA
jgi:predicted phosphodiesterase